MRWYRLIACIAVVSCAPAVVAPGFEPNAGVDPQDDRDAGWAAVVDSGSVAVDAGPPPAFLGAERRVPVLLPDAWNRNQRWPLVILLHGYSASGGGQDRYFGVSSRRNDFGFIALAPDGNRDRRGNRFWNATSTCCDFWRTRVDDLAYIRGLIAEAIERLSVDPDRVYLIGHSNGGFMSNRVACDAADDVTAILNIAGASFNDATRCEPSRAVGYIQVHGTQDTVIRYPGGRLQAGGEYPGAEVLVERWRSRNGCMTSSTSGEAEDFDRSVPGSETVRAVWSECAGRKPVQLWTMEGTGHIPGFNDDFRDAMLEALLAY